LLLGSPLLHAQQIADSVYWVYFIDKAGNGFALDHPADFLSERSIQRRAFQGLAVDEQDLPVTPGYLQQLRENGAEIKHVSRWLNGAVIINADSLLFEALLALPFTDTVPWEPDKNLHYFPALTGGERFQAPLDIPPGFDYGPSLDQAAMLGADHLHDLGYTGKGVQIAVMDAGFLNVDSLPAFEVLIGEGRLLGSRNFVNDLPVMRVKAAHGMNVLSTMASIWEGNLVGTAPHAGYFLCMTEDPFRETRMEEIAWIEAAEYMDSLGYDVINTSLGYSDFDGEAFDYTYSDMDGRTTFISRAASLTASRGMILCNSAGNEGDDPWFYITAPADATDILAVGAVDVNEVITSFSSRGPSYDARIKPDVAAMGSRSVVQDVGGGLALASGTSFSSPILAGAVASLWQAYPELSALQMIRWIRQNGDRHKNPDSTYGFGIPDVAKAYWNITHVPSGLRPGRLEIFPNPASDLIRVRLPGEPQGVQLLRMYDMSGRMVVSMQVDLHEEVILPTAMGTGIYILEVRTDRNIYRGRFTKE